jgi:hypothetical protein
VDIDNLTSASVITSANDPRCFDTFRSIYGIDLSN